MTVLRTNIFALASILSAIACAGPLEVDPSVGVIEASTVDELADADPVEDTAPSDVEPSTELKILADVSTPSICQQDNLVAPAAGKCLLIEGRFEVYALSTKEGTSQCNRWPGTYTCVSTDRSVYLVGEGTVKEMALPRSGYCELCPSDYIDGYVSAKYATGSR